MIEQLTPTILDTSPRGLADALDTLAQQLISEDRECAAILIQARESLRALGWNRYAQRINRRSERLALTRRLRAHAGWRAAR